MWKKAVAAAVVIGLVVALLLARSKHRATGPHGSDPEAVRALAGQRAEREASKPASAAGRVTRAADGGGVAGATVALSRSEFNVADDGENLDSLLATTDATGAWSVPVIAPGTYIVAATAAGFLPKARERVAIASGEHRTGLDLALDAGGTRVHGSVTDVGGGAIAGARITAIADNGIDILFGHAEYVTLTAEDGRYELALADGSYRLLASRDDYTSQRSSIEVAGKPIVADFVLIPGGTVRGLVIARDTGKPVPHAYVAGAGRQTVCDDDGSFTLHGVRSGALALTAIGHGYASSAPTTVEVGIGEQIDGVRVLVDRAYSISGTIVRSGAPATGVAGAHVVAFSIASGAEGQTREPSRDDGTFEIEGLRPGTYTLFALGEHAVPAIGKTVEIVDRDVTGVVIELASGATLSGRVEPPRVASISVSLGVEIGLGNMFEAVKTAFVHAQSDASGAFTLSNVPAGKLVLEATTREGPAGKLPVTVTDVDQSGLVITLETRGSIAGRVVDTHHAPVAGVHVDAEAIDHPRVISLDENSGVTTDADGAFRLVGLEAGKYRVAASARPAASDKKPELELELAKGEAKTGVVLTVAAHDGVIRGQVVGADGNPEADAWVTARLLAESGDDAPVDESRPVLTKDTGRFAIERLAAGKYVVVAQTARGSARAEQRGVKPGDTVTLTLMSLGTLSGHLTSRGAPVASYQLTCRGPDETIDRSITAADGAYLLEHLAPGSYACSATADTGTASGSVEVPSGAATLELSLVGWASIGGKVVDVLTGRPIASLPVIASPAGSEGREFGAVVTGQVPTTDATGQFVIERVAEGKGELMVFARSGSMDPLATRPYTTVSGQRAELGTIEVVAPRTTEAGTLGLVAGVDDKGLGVMSVVPGGPAAAAGIVAGDRIVAIDGRPVATIGPDVAQRVIASGTIGIGVTVALELARGVTAQVTSIKW